MKKTYFLKPTMNLHNVTILSDPHKPLGLPPNTPADRVKIIREAFQKTLSDEAALADAKKKRLEIDPTSSDELEKLAKEVVGQPQDIVTKMKQL